MIYNHISHSAPHSGWTQLICEFIKVKTETQISSLIYLIGYSKGGRKVSVPLH